MAQTPGAPDTRWDRLVQEHRSRQRSSGSAESSRSVGWAIRLALCGLLLGSVVVVAGVSVEAARWNDSARCERAVVGDNVELWRAGWGEGDWCVRFDEAGNRMGDRRVGAGPTVRSRGDVLTDNAPALFALGECSAVAVAYLVRPRWRWRGVRLRRS